MINPIEPVGMFHTPENEKEFHDYLARLSGAERGVATVAAMMAWNLASKLVDETIEAEGSNDSNK